MMDNPQEPNPERGPLDRLTENEQLIVDHTHQGAHDLVLDGRVLRAQIEKRNGHGPGEVNEDS